jgi:hypothetical protein
MRGKKLFMRSVIKSEVIPRGLFDIHDMDNIFHITSPDKVVRLIRKVHEDRSKNDHVCVNYTTYRVEFEEH